MMINVAAEPRLDPTWLRSALCTRLRSAPASARIAHVCTLHYCTRLRSALHTSARNARIAHVCTLHALHICTHWTQPHKRSLLAKLAGSAGRRRLAKLASQRGKGADAPPRDEQGLVDMLALKTHRSCKSMFSIVLGTSCGLDMSRPKDTSCLHVCTLHAFHALHTSAPCTPHALHNVHALHTLHALAPELSHTAGPNGIVILNVQALHALHALSRHIVASRADSKRTYTRTDASECGKDSCNASLSRNRSTYAHLSRNRNDAKAKHEYRNKHADRGMRQTIREDMHTIRNGAI